MPQTIKNITLYDVEEIARILGKHPQTILRWINKKEIKAVKFKPRESYWVEREELERIVTEQNMPLDMIEYRLGLKSPKSGAML